MLSNTIAFILAAGLGTRLKPFTDYQPKALVPLIDKPLLQHVIEHMLQFGIRHIVINVHHFPQQIKNFVTDLALQLPHVQFYISDESEQLLDTGGAIKKAKDIFVKGDMAQVLVYNADILSNINLEQMQALLQDSQSDAVLAVRHRSSSRYLHFDAQDHLAAWSNPSKALVKYCKTGDLQQWQTAAFSGIHLFKTDVLAHLPNEDVFSIIDWYLQLAREDFQLKAYWHDADYWFDMGKPQELEDARNFYLQHR